VLHNLVDKTFAEWMDEEQREGLSKEQMPKVEHLLDETIKAYLEYYLSRDSASLKVLRNIARANLLDYIKNPTKDTFPFENVSVQT
jgi:hypothetical protein